MFGADPVFHTSLAQMQRPRQPYWGQTCKIFSEFIQIGARRPSLGLVFWPTRLLRESQLFSPVSCNLHHTIAIARVQSQQKNKWRLKADLRLCDDWFTDPMKRMAYFLTMKLEFNTFRINCHMWISFFHSSMQVLCWQVGKWISSDKCICLDWKCICTD